MQARRLRAGAAGDLGPGRRPAAVPADLAAHRDPGPGAPGPDRRGAARAGQHRPAPRRPVDAHRAAVPRVSGSSPRFVVDRLPGGGRRRCATGARRAGAAGTCSGPLRLRLVDPFGLVERSAVGTDTASLVVVPRVRPLGAGGPAGGHGGGGEGARRSIAVHGEDDVSTREYRHGDDLRKVHWRATARTGELMVRLEERPWRGAGDPAARHPRPGAPAGPAHASAPRVGPGRRTTTRPPTAWSG